MYQRHETMMTGDEKEFAVMDKIIVLMVTGAHKQVFASN